MSGYRRSLVTHAALQMAALLAVAQQPAPKEEFGIESESKPRKPTKAEKKAAKRARHG